MPAGAASWKAIFYGGAVAGLVFGVGLASAGRAIAAAAQQLRGEETPPDGLSSAEATTFARAEAWKGTRWVG